MTFDKAGNLYGTTFAGGASGKGIVFKLTSAYSGWTESVLYASVGMTARRQRADLSWTQPTISTEQLSKVVQDTA